MKRKATCAAEVASHGDDLVNIGTALNDHVDLDIFEANSQRRVNALKDVHYGKVHVIHFSKDAVVKGIETHGQAR